MKLKYFAAHHENTLYVLSILSVVDVLLYAEVLSCLCIQLRQFNRKKSCSYAFWHKNPVQKNYVCCCKVLRISEFTKKTTCVKPVENATATFFGR